MIYRYSINRSSFATTEYWSTSNTRYSHQMIRGSRGLTSAGENVWDCQTLIKGYLYLYMYIFMFFVGFFIGVFFINGFDIFVF